MAAEEQDSLEEGPLEGGRAQRARTGHGNPNRGPDVERSQMKKPGGPRAWGEGGGGGGTDRLSHSFSWRAREAGAWKKVMDQRCPTEITTWATYVISSFLVATLYKKKKGTGDINFNILKFTHIYPKCYHFNT